uniref:Uncharacterized protein n=1 Tax=Anopheles coluzzii TaxID=1518534 RepID=A0A6E8VTI5_ANOCL
MCLCVVELVLLKLEHYATKLKQRGNVFRAAHIHSASNGSFFGGASRLEDNMSEAENGDTFSISFHGRQPPTGNGNVQKKAPVPFFLSRKRIWATSQSVHTHFLYTACHTIAADEM